jgi:hypothetical protein
MRAFTIADDIELLNSIAWEYLIYYIGTVNTIDIGLKRFYKYLDNYGQILVEEPQIVDFLRDGEIIQVILYNSLGKLEYLEYMWEKKYK